MPFTNDMIIQNKVPYFDGESVRCPFCCGDRQITLGERDPIEGSKMQWVDKCPMCEGKGHIHETTTIGKASLAFWTAYEDSYNHEAIKRRALSKLTKEEKRALGLE